MSLGDESGDGGVAHGRRAPGTCHVAAGQSSAPQAVLRLQWSADISRAGCLKQYCGKVQRRP
jgi:hypothetical protein